MKRSEIYLKAAELIIEPTSAVYACHVIESITGEDPDELTMPELFNFKENDYLSFLGGQYRLDEPTGHVIYLNDKIMREFKSTVLLFASELAKDTNN
jgi:hypothetical protein